MKVEIAVTGPNDSMRPNAVYAEWKGIYGLNFYNIGDTNHDGRRHLESRGAQFHTIDIPDWKDPVPVALDKLSQLVGDLEWDFQGKRAKQATEVINLLKGAKQA